MAGITAHKITNHKITHHQITGYRMTKPKKAKNTPRAHHKHFPHKASYPRLKK